MVVLPRAAAGVSVPPPPAEAKATAGPSPSSLVPAIIARWTQSMPVWASSLKLRLTMTVSMTTWESMMSMLWMMSRMTSMSPKLAMMMRALVRSSARILMFSLSSWPKRVLASPPAAGALDSAARAAAAGAAAAGSPSRRAVGRASLSEAFLLPMSSLRSAAASLATACSRRWTSTTTSGAVGMSSCSMTLLKKTMFSGRVMMMSRLVRSSAMMLTLPRMMPRWASATRASKVSAPLLAGSGSRRPGRVTPGGRVRRSVPGAPVERSWGMEDFLPLCSSCALLTISSMRALMSVALA